MYLTLVGLEDQGSRELQQRLQTAGYHLEFVGIGDAQIVRDGTEWDRQEPLPSDLADDLEANKTVYGIIAIDAGDDDNEPWQQQEMFLRHDITPGEHYIVLLRVDDSTLAKKCKDIGTKVGLEVQVVDNIRSSLDASQYHVLCAIVNIASTKKVMFEILALRGSLLMSLWNGEGIGINGHKYRWWVMDKVNIEYHQQQGDIPPVLLPLVLAVFDEERSDVT